MLLAVAFKCGTLTYLAIAAFIVYSSLKWIPRPAEEPVEYWDLLPLGDDPATVPPAPSRDSLK